MNKLYLASHNEAKLIAAKKAFSNFDVVSVSVDTDNVKQPLSEEETLECAKRRACAINNCYRLGLEAGVTLIGEKCFLVNYGVLIDSNNNEYYAGGSYVPLPDEVKNDLYKNKLELKDAIIKHYGNVINEQGGTIEYLTNKEVTRVDIFTHICMILKGLMEKEGK